MHSRLMACAVSLLLALAPGMTMAKGGNPDAAQETTNPKEFKILKEKRTDPKTGLPKTLDPNLFAGQAKRAYQVAREIPEILAQMPCFCGCEAVGHQSLLDCFVDRHGEG
jgi:hypothetical protein